MSRAGVKMLCILLVVPIIFRTQLLCSTNPMLQLRVEMEPMVEKTKTCEYFLFLNFVIFEFSVMKISL
jgi:hypothetical protein